MVVSGCLDDLKARYQRVHVVFENGMELPARWPEGAESIRKEGRIVSMLCSHNADAIVEQAQSIPGSTVERFPVTLKEMFLEHVRSN
jgi:hypothetical protein